MTLGSVETGGLGGYSLWWIGPAGALLGAGATATLIGWLRHRSILDVPNERSTHRQAVPRGGGVAVALAALAVLAASDGLHHSTAGLPVAALVVAGFGAGAIGLADDLARGLPVALRLAALVVVAATAAGLAVEVAGLGAWTVPAAVAAVVWIVGYTNTFNFMDGINGIAAAQAAIAGVALGLIAAARHLPGLETAAFALAAAAVGFAPFNFPKARIFLGDAGSYFAGAWLAVLVVAALIDRVPPEAAGAPLVVFSADAGVTLARRISRHEPWHRPHRQHVYQRLVDGGWSQTAATATVAALVAGCSALGAVSLDRGGLALRCGADVAIAALVAGYLFLPRLAGVAAIPAPLGAAAGGAGRP